jgi:hypothetical protein
MFTGCRTDILTARKYAPAATEVAFSADIREAAHAAKPRGGAKSECCAITATRPR